MLALFNPKIIVQPGVWWIAGGLITAGGITIGVVAKIITKNFITWKNAREEFQTVLMSNEKDKALGKRIDDLNKSMNSRFDGMDNQLGNIVTLIQGKK